MLRSVDVIGERVLRIALQRRSDTRTVCRLQIDGKMLVRSRARVFIRSLRCARAAFRASANEALRFTSDPTLNRVVGNEHTREPVYVTAGEMTDTSALFQSIIPVREGRIAFQNYLVLK